MKILRTFFRGVACCLVCSSTVADPLSLDITGNYSCSGYDPFNKLAYTIPLTVAKSEATYSFQWLNAQGSAFMLGTGIMASNLKNRVAVLFWDPLKADYFGTELFVIRADGSMQANWIVQGENKLGSEVCIRKKS